MVTEKWVQAVLPPEYENQPQGARGKGNKWKSGRINSSEQAQPELETEEFEVIWQIKPEVIRLAD